MEDDTVLRLYCVDSYTNIPCTTQKIIISKYKDECYSKLKIPFGCKLYYKEDKELTLLYACKHSFRETAIGMISNNQVDDVDEIDENGNTALIWACSNSMSYVATLLITIFGDKCNPQQVNSNGVTALILACYNSMADVAILLITTFGDKCNPQQVDDDGVTALLLACENSMSDVATLLITTFGDKCNLQPVNPYCKIALSLASKNKMNDVVVLLKQYS
jgi:ankyrin repeat protein